MSAKPTRAKYDEATKAAAMAALLSGQATSTVAAEYKVPEGTVKAWRNRAKQTPLVATEKAEEIGELLVSYLRENLKTLQAQQPTFRDPVWLAKQDASELAVLHGVLTDKAVRLMEAMSPRQDAA